MQNRLNQNDVTNRINVEDADQVRDAVVALFSQRFPGSDLAPLRHAFDDVKALFEGRYPGYLVCDTLYHDMRHTLDVTSPSAPHDGHERTQAEVTAWRRRAMLGGSCAAARLGIHEAQFAQVERRGVHQDSRRTQRGFLALPALDRFGNEAATAARLVHYTGYEMDIDDIKVDDARDCRLLWGLQIL